MEAWCAVAHGVTKSWTWLSYWTELNEVIGGFRFKGNKTSHQEFQWFCRKDGWMASPTQWTWVWVSSGNWWWTGRPGVLQSIGLQRVEHNWVTELNWMLKNARIKCSLHFAMWMLQMRLVVFKNLCVYWEDVLYTTSLTLSSAIEFLAQMRNPSDSLPYNQRM